jgi:hypothetical protein
MIVYREPKRSAADDLGLIVALMRAPTSAAVRPEENQFSEALAWALRRVPGLARDFALLFVAGDAEAENAIRSASEIGVDTRVTARGPSGEVLFPDISLCGSGLAFQLLVEVKVGSGFHEYPLADGSMVFQPEIYARALELDPPAVGADVRRVGTLSRRPEEAPKHGHPLRAHDVSWSAVRDLLRNATPPAGIAGVFDEVVQAISARILPTPPSDEHIEALLMWARGLLPDLLRSLAARVDGTTSGRVGKGIRVPFRAGTVHYAAGATELKMWVCVSPGGVGYSVPGEPDAVYLIPDEERKAATVSLGPLAHGFRYERDIEGYDNWRTWLPADEVRKAGPQAAQVALLTGAFAEALAAAGLLKPE